MQLQTSADHLLVSSVQAADILATAISSYISKTNCIHANRKITAEIYMKENDLLLKF